jgi:hypothetical protein
MDARVKPEHDGFPLLVIARLDRAIHVSSPEKLASCAHAAFAPARRLNLQRSLP